MNLWCVLGRPHALFNCEDVALPTFAFLHHPYIIQFSLEVGFLPQYNLEIDLYVGVVSIQW